MHCHNNDIVAVVGIRTNPLNTRMDMSRSRSHDFTHWVTVKPVIKRNIGSYKNVTANRKGNNNYVNVSGQRDPCDQAKAPFSSSFRVTFSPSSSSSVFLTPLLLRNFSRLFAASSVLPCLEPPSLTSSAQLSRPSYPLRYCRRLSRFVVVGEPIVTVLAVTCPFVSIRSSSTLSSRPGLRRPRFGP